MLIWKFTFLRDLSMTLPTLFQLNSNHELIKELLLEKNLTMSEYPVADWQKIVPDETDFAFCSGTTKLAAALTVYAIQSETIFYSVIFPDYSHNQIRQLTSLLDFVKTILKEKSSTYEPHNRFMLANNCLIVDNKKISLFSNNNKVFLSKYSTVTLVDKLLLPNLSFETVYSTILNDFNEKISVMLNAELATINTTSIIRLQEETNEEFITRTHKNRIVKALSVTAFKQHIDGLCLPIQSIPYDVKNKSLDSNSMYVMDIYGRHKFAVGIQKINKLKSILSPLMSDNDITQLVQLLSISQFYSHLLHPEFNNNCVEFSQKDLSLLSKESLSNNPAYMEFSIGIFDFEIADKFKIDNYMDGEQYFLTINEAYDYLLDYIQQNICKVLHANIENVCNKDLLVIDMMNC